MSVCAGVDDDSEAMTTVVAQVVGDFGGSNNGRTA